MVGVNGSIGIGVFGSKNSSGNSNTEYKEFVVANNPQADFDLDNNADSVYVILNRVPQSLVRNDYTFDKNVNAKRVTFPEALPIGSLVVIIGLKN